MKFVVSSASYENGFMLNNKYPKYIDYVKANKPNIKEKCVFDKKVNAWVIEIPTLDKLMEIVRNYGYGSYECCGKALVGTYSDDIEYGYLYFYDDNVK